VGSSPQKGLFATMVTVGERGTGTDERGLLGAPGPAAAEGGPRPPGGRDAGTPAGAGRPHRPHSPRGVRRPVSPRRRTVPARLRWFTGGCLLLTTVLGAVGLNAALGARTTWSAVTNRQAPQIVAASGLYQELTDLDGQAANLLMFGDAPQLATQRATALAQYSRDRTGADSDLQRATLDTAGDTKVQQSLLAVLDGMGSYQDLAARAMELDDVAHAGTGHPDPAALAEYRQATDLMRTTLLPAADQLVQADNDAFNHSYASERSALNAAEWWTAVLGAALLLSLTGLQLWLALRFRRIVNPPLVAATLVTLVLVATAGTLWSDQRGYLWVARRQAFDSVVALTRARAVAYDANADESRYLLDQGRAAQYQNAFQSDSMEIASLPGATIHSYDTELAAAVAAYQQNHDDVRFGGFYGAEFKNITFGGERAAAEQALTAYQAYERDDRKIRALVGEGRLQQAIASCVSLAPGGSNADFALHDAALQRVIAINDQAYQAASDHGRGELRLRIPLLLGGVGVVLLLCLIGVRPRLAEFRAG